MMTTGRPRTAVLIPCRNEEATVGGVVEGFRASLPDADIYVYDNASTDRTAAIARDAGAHVRTEPRAGKGRVVRRMFADVEADIFVLVDGDMTYDAAVAPTLVNRLQDESLDMVVGARTETGGGEYRRGHRFGNRLLSGTIATLFAADIADMMSGYRVFSRRFVKSFPATATGFEIETEMTVHALEVGAPMTEVFTDYGARPEGSESKLSTWRDGLRILTAIFGLLRQERPLAVFGGFGVAMLVLAALMFLPILTTYLETGLVPRFPTLVASAALGLTGLIAIFSGLILSSVARTRRDVKRLAYLALPAPPKRID